MKILRKRKHFRGALQKYDSRNEDFSFEKINSQLNKINNKP